MSINSEIGNGIVYSIIIVCLNAGERLADTVASVRAQTYKEYEIIIKDGGSTDGSPQRVETDDRTHVIIRKDNGIYDAMNQAVAEASGSWLLFLNTGDSLYNDRVLEDMAAAIPAGENANKKTVDIIYGNLYHKALDTVIYASPQINDFACYRNVPCHQSCFYRRSLFEERGYDTRYTVRADYEHFLWCYYEKKADIRYVPMIVASYEGGGYSETKENKKRSARQHREIVVKYMGRGKADKYRLLLLLTLAPLRSALAGSRHFSRFYNSIKTAVYKLFKGG
ncbi:MAG: glycosyltransferase [Roseburia sp.]|nr:glycosyltransferase [Roseburia sp.]